MLLVWVDIIGVIFVVICWYLLLEIKFDKLKNVVEVWFNNLFEYFIVIRVFLNVVGFGLFVIFVILVFCCVIFVLNVGL